MQYLAPAHWSKICSGAQVEEQRSPRVGANTLQSPDVVAITVSANSSMAVQAVQQYGNGLYRTSERIISQYWSAVQPLESNRCLHLTEVDFK